MKLTVFVAVLSLVLSTTQAAASNPYDLEHSRPDVAATTPSKDPEPGTICYECVAWENHCKELCGRGRVCDELCRCKRAERHLCRLAGCMGNVPEHCSNKPRRGIEDKPVPGGFAGYWAAFGHGLPI